LRAPRRLLLLILALPAVAWPQASPDEQARGLLEDGRTYRREGKLKQALDNFQTIVSGFSNTEMVDDALLEIGRYHLEVEADAGKARDAFEQVAKRFPQSDGAPGAYYYLGFLLLERATTAAELEDALAQFTRVQRLYPRSDWVAMALQASSLVHRRAGRFPEAADAARRVALEHPTSAAAPAAQFQVGHALALQGEARQAMEEFQQVRNRYPDSEWAPRALDRITALYRLYGAGKAVFVADPAFSVGAGDVLKDVRAVLMTPTGTFWIASAKAKGAIPFGADGKMGASLHADDVQGLSLSAQGLLVVSAARAVRIGPKDIRSLSMPGEKPGETEPLEGIEAAVLTDGGSLLVSDEKRKKILRFDGTGKYVGPFPDAKERRVSRMLLDGEGGIVTLDREDRTVRVLDDAGRVLRSVPPRGAGYDMRRPVDVAVDPFRNLYVADEEAGLLVFSPGGQLLAGVGTAELRKARAVTVDPAGAILVYDEKLERVLRFK
jgi:outer membrane protein assembly factor BamD (BamD/ComL family)